MNKLFQSTSINGLELNNRFIRSATWEGMCDNDGCPTAKLTDLYVQLARGGVGLIITGYAIVREDGKQLPATLGLHLDDFQQEMEKMTDAIHSAGGKICAQLVHAGGQATSQNCGSTPIAPSAVEVDQYPEEVQEMSINEINDVISCFGKAAKRAKSYGFDAVQLHGAHGYLINQFLSPLTNRRQDEYGGSNENRCRFVLEIYRAVRQQVGEDFPVMIKLSCNDFLDNGVSLKQATMAAQLLSRERIDCIEVSGGTPASGKKSPARMKINKKELEAYHLPLAEEIKKHVDCPIMVVGGMRSLEVMEQAVNQGKSDYISMARPFIRQPNLVNLFSEGKIKQVDCISCNGCFLPGIKYGGIKCVIEEKEKKKAQKKAEQTDQ